MGDYPREYNKEFATGPGRRSHRRLGVDIDRGTVTRFVLQLEYLTDPPANEWSTGVRYDHDSEGGTEAAHNVTKDGLHIDIYRDGEKVDSHKLTPPLPPNHTLNIVEDHLNEQLEVLRL